MNDDNNILEDYVNEFRIMMHKYQESFGTTLQKKLNDITTDFKTAFELILKSIDQTFEPLNQLIKDWTEDGPPAIKEALLTFGNHGWYISIRGMSIPFIGKVLEAYAQKNDAIAEKALINYFESRTDAIEELIVREFPKRAKIIKAAIAAHRKCEYELSIPVLLAQADGICQEAAERSLFIYENGKPETAIYVEQLASNSIMEAILQPLAQPLPISYSRKKRSKNFGQLNRHMVLHGESLDYGTRLNSLKAISLLNYVAQAMSDK